MTAEATSKDYALIAARAIDEKKGTDIIIQDVSELLNITDFFVICTAANNRRVDAIAEAVEEQLHKEADIKPSSVEGLDESQWVLMDYESRKIVPGGNIYPLDEYCMVQSFEGRFPRTRGFEAQGEAYTMVPPWSDFDVNGHVNNTKYANFVLDAVAPGEGERIRELRMEYHREVLPGEKLHILTRREGTALFARGESDSGERMFSCSIEFEEV